MLLECRSANLYECLICSWKIEFMICSFLLECEFYFFVGTVSLSICYLKVVAEVHFHNEHWSWAFHEWTLELGCLGCDGAALTRSASLRHPWVAIASYLGPQAPLSLVGGSSSCSVYLCMRTAARPAVSTRPAVAQECFNEFILWTLRLLLDFFLRSFHYFASGTWSLSDFTVAYYK